MRAIIIILLASAFGYGVLQIDKLDPNNYVKMYIGNHVVEIKVLGFILLLIACVAMLYFVLWLLRLIWRSPKLFSNWRGGRNRDKADDQFGAGYLSLIKGDWRRAETQLLAKSKHSHIPYVNFLAAARAAQEQGKIEQRDQHLAAAYKAAPKERLAIGLTKAKLHAKANQFQQALITLEDIAPLAKNNPQYTAMLIQVHEEQRNWHSIEALLPAAKKQKALPSELLDDLQHNVYLHELRDAKDKQTAWNGLPRAQRKRPAMVEVYAQDRVQNGEPAVAEKLITSTLKGDWSDELVDIYGQLPTEKPQKLLRRVQGWLMARPENAHLNLAAGRLAKASKSLDEAKKYLQTAITQGQLPAAYSELGEVFEADNDSGKALQMYRVGMQALAQENPKQALLKAEDNTAERDSTATAA